MSAFRIDGEFGAFLMLEFEPANCNELDDGWTAVSFSAAAGAFSAAVEGSLMLKEVRALAQRLSLLEEKQLTLEFDALEEWITLCIRSDQVRGHVIVEVTIRDGSKKASLSVRFTTDPFRLGVFARGLRDCLP
jgi:hypothetical protein